MKTPFLARTPNFNDGKEMVKNLSNATEALIHEDNKYYPVACVRDLSKGNPDCLCREEIQVNDNKFCNRIAPEVLFTCRIVHRNSDAEKVRLNNNLIITTTPGKKHAFVQLGDVSNVAKSDLQSW